MERRERVLEDDGILLLRTQFLGSENHHIRLQELEGDPSEIEL